MEKLFKKWTDHVSFDISIMQKCYSKADHYQATSCFEHHVQILQAARWRIMTRLNTAAAVVKL